MKRIILEQTHPNAVIPFKATKGSACYDVYAVEDVTLVKGHTSKVSIGWKMRCPKGMSIQIVPRSGLSIKGVIIINSPGTIDSDFPDECKILMTTIYADVYWIHTRDRIAQIRILNEIPTKFKYGIVKKTTDRSGGYGSTGK